MTATEPAFEIPVIHIGPVRGLGMVDFKELWRYRELLYFLVWRNVKVRYKQTAIGAAWAIIQPLTTMIIFTLVFRKFANVPSDGLPYPIFSYAALIPWTYFATSLSQSTLSLTNNANLITKIYFPRILLPLSAVLSGLVDFGVSFLFLICLMIWYGIAPTRGMLLLPFFVLLIMLTALAVSLWLSVINVRYRDVGQAIPFVVQIWMFVSPVAYPVSVVPADLRMLYDLNPMAGVIEGFRWAVTGTDDPRFLLVLTSTLIVCATLYGGILFFRRMQDTLADVV